LHSDPPKRYHPGNCSGGKGELMGITVQFPDWRQHLHELVIEAELRIGEAEHRIENHHKLWPLSAGSCAHRRAHAELEQTLIGSLELLHTWRSMLLHEACGATIPRAPVVSGSEPTARNRQAHLAEVIAWLDELPPTIVSNVIAEQRERASQELWQLKKRQLWEPLSTPSIHQDALRR